MTRRVLGVYGTMAISILAVLGCGRSSSLTSSAASIAGAGASSGAPAQVAYDAVGSDMQAADSLRHGPCGPAGLPLGIPSGCPYDAGSQSFVCGPDVSDDGLTRTRSYQFLDASGSAQSAYDSLTTASIRFVSHVSGKRTGPWRNSTVNDQFDLVESGLAGTETARVWNGGGTSSRVDSLSGPNGTVRQFTLTSTTTVAQVVVPAPWARRSWPLSGTIANHVVTSGGIDQTSVITFNGTEFVPLTIGGTTVTIDLARHPGGGPGGPIADEPGDDHRGGHGPGPGHGPRGGGRGGR